MAVVFPSVPPPRPVVRAGVGTAVALGASTAVLLFSLLTLGTTWLSRRGPPPAGESTAFPAISADVDLWVAEWAPGVKAVLSGTWNDPVWDRNQDAESNRGLHVSGAEALGFCEFVAFNTSDEAASLSLGEGAIRVRAGEKTVGSVDLARLLARPEAAASASAGTLRALGADRATVDLPPGRMLRRPVAFPAGVSLPDATAVESADGAAFHRRRIRRGEWAGLLHSPSVDQIRAL